MHYKSIHLSLLILIMLFSTSGKTEIKKGDTAPTFEMLDQYNKTHGLSDYRGQWVVLYFYPKDDTPGCTTEACNFRDDIFKIRELNAEVIGVSVDNTKSHAKFAGKHGLPFPLLSDGDASVARSYGSAMSLGPIKIAKRHTFIIDPEGNVAAVYRDVKPANHSAEIIRDLQSLQAKDKTGDP